MAPLALDLFKRLVSRLVFEEVEDVKNAMREVSDRLEKLYLDPENEELLYGNN